jgi:hypothetical protein
LLHILFSSLPSPGRFPSGLAAPRLGGIASALFFGVLAVERQEAGEKFIFWALRLLF